MRRRSGWWLAAAALSFLVGTWLLGLGEEEVPRLRRDDRVDFPKGLRTHEVERAHERRRPELRTTEPDPEEEMFEELEVTDPVLRALPSADGSSTVVVEANALRHSALGEMFVDCLPRGDQDGVRRIREELGIDPLEDLDRVAVAGDVLVLAGHFEQARWERLFGEWQSEAYGDAGRIYWQPVDGDERATVTAVWNDELVLTGDDRDAIEAALDRVEGRRLADPPLDESQTYGEVYGVLDAARVADLFPAGQSDVADRLREIVERVELHVDGMTDVAMTATLVGTDDLAMEDLARSIGAALAVARMTARARDEVELAMLLEHARIEPYGRTFALELALPQEALAEHLRATCAARRELEAAAGEEGGAASEASPEPLPGSDVPLDALPDTDAPPEAAVPSDG